MSLKFLPKFHGSFFCHKKTGTSNRATDSNPILFIEPFLQKNQSYNMLSNILSNIIRQRGTWKGPLKVLPFVEGIVGLPSRRR